MLTSKKNSSGFTLIELVITIVIVGILAITIIPRFISSSELKPYSYRDQLLTTLRHAQYMAMSDRSTGACYQVHIESKRFGYDYQTLSSCSNSLVSGASFSPFEVESNSTPNQTDLGAIIDENDISITATDLSGNDILNADIRFNGIGQPSWLDGSGVEQSDCSGGCQIKVNEQALCVGEQGFIREGEC